MAAKLTSVTCNHCGAPLQVPDTTRFVTCSYCGTRLEVHRSGNAVYTEVLAALDQRTQQMAEDLTHIKRQNEIERLDREWQMRRESLMVRGKHGSVHEPTSLGAVTGSVIAIVFGVIWMIVTASAGAPGVFVLFGVVFIIVAVAGALTSAGKASRYRDAEQSYLRQRDALVRADRTQQ